MNFSNLKKYLSASVWFALSLSIIILVMIFENGNLASDTFIGTITHTSISRDGMRPNRNEGMLTIMISYPDGLGNHLSASHTEVGNLRALEKRVQEKYRQGTKLEVKIDADTPQSFKYPRNHFWFIWIVTGLIVFYLAMQGLAVLLSEKVGDNNQ